MRHFYKLVSFSKNHPTINFSFLLLFALFFSATSYGQTYQDTTPFGNETFTVPANVYSLTVECWAAGGAGGGDSQNGGVDGAGGGGGGAYASSVIAVTPGQILTYNVGAGGAGVDGNGANGGPTWFSAVGTLYAEGGFGGSSANSGRAGGIGGTVAGSIGTTRTAGSNGQNGAVTRGGFGGNGANPAGGAGGALINTEGDGNDANLTAHGGGGGGAFTPDNTDHAGGSGADGELFITYSTCEPPTITAPTAVTSISATINWTAPGGGTTPTGYEYVVSTTNTAPVGAGTADAASPANTTGLSANTTYYIFVRTNCGGGIFSSWDGPRSFTTPNGVSNDEPCGAIALSSGCTAGTNIASTPSTVSPVNLAGCASHSGLEDDVWFSYVVGPSGSLEITALLGSMSDPAIAVYSGTCSGNLNLIDCDDDSAFGAIGGATLEPYILLTGQTPGTTIYIRLWRWNDDSGTNSGTFSICVNDIADPCAAIVNIPNCGATTINATIASGTGAFNDSCFDTPGDEQIYSFTPTVTGTYNITQISTFGHINYGFNTVCGSNGWTCIDDLTGNNQSSSFFSMDAGTTYYIMLDSEDNAGGNVSFTLNCPPPVPPNDLCSNAITLNCGDSNLAGTTVSSTNTPHGLPTCVMSNYGVWYTFIGDGDQTTIFTQASAGFNHELSINSSSAACTSFTNIACVDVGGLGGIETYTFITTVGVRYFVYLAFRGTGTQVGDFTISRSCIPVTPPPNDDPCNATDLIVNASCVPTSATNQFATNTIGVANPSCENYLGGDVWFTVTVPPSPNNEITIDTQAGQLTDSGMAVYAGTCSGTLTEIACDGNSSAGSMSQLTLTNSGNGITTGQVLYIRVWEDGNNNNGSFAICVTAPTPANFDVDICQSDPSEPMATDLFCFDAAAGIDLGSGVVNTITGSLSASSPQAFSQNWSRVSTDPCQFSTINFRRYEAQTFTVTATGTYVFEIISPTTLFDPMGYIYDNTGTTVPGTCGSGYIAGDDDSGPGLWSVITAFLQVGESYTLITTNALGTSTETGSYTWDVGNGAAPTSAEWYTTATGGTPIGYGSYFDPVTAGVLTDTDTPGTTSFWVGCPNSSAPRVETFFTINPRPTATISGASSGGACGSYEITITGSDPSATWAFYYQIDGGTPIGIFGVTSPHTFTATAPSGSVYTLSNAVDYNFPACTALPAGLTGSATVTTAAKTWNGTISTAWTNPNNWSPAGVPTLSDCVLIPNTGANFDPIIDGTNDNAQAGSLTVQNGGDLLVLPGGTITVQNDVTVVAGGTFELSGSAGTIINDGNDGNPTDFNSSLTANLIQNNPTASNSGIITLERHAFVRIQDYVYWSSPTVGFDTSSIYNTQYIYEWIPTVFTNINEQYGNWNGATGTTMEAGKGYIVRGPSGNGNSNTVGTWNNVVFSGVPHNGLYQPAIERGTDTTGGNGNNNGDPGDEVSDGDDDNWNLIGNPYPSNISADDFLLENADDNVRIDGVVYFWTHGIQIRRGNSPFFGDYTLSYDEADYDSYNYLGSPNTGLSGIIGSGQGFFVFMDDSYGTQSGTGNAAQQNLYQGTVTFNNSMRVGSNEEFFRTANTGRRSFEYERHRIWLSLVQPSNDVSTMLVGYMEGATMEKDKMYDAKFMDGSSRKLYSIIDDNSNRFVIQGRALPFDESDTIPLGIIIDQQGEYAINLEDVDGIFDMALAQDVFIEDMELEITHNIKESPYFFTPTEMGEFTDRFRIRFTNNSLGVDEFNLNNGLTIIAPNSDYIKINSSHNSISSVKVYDLLGRSLMHFDDVNKSELVIENSTQSDGVLMVQVTLDNGQQKTQKVVLRR